MLLIVQQRNIRFSQSFLFLQTLPGVVLCRLRRSVPISKVAIGDKRRYDIMFSILYPLSRYSLPLNFPNKRTGRSKVKLTPKRIMMSSIYCDVHLNLKRNSIVLERLPPPPHILLGTRCDVDGRHRRCRCGRRGSWMLMVLEYIATTLYSKPFLSFPSSSFATCGNERACSSFESPSIWCLSISQGR